jgi:predicted CXXCH cytochrome family protein
VVDIAVFAANNTLPLHNGKMSCVTCHDPHLPLAAVRMVEPELCAQCHPR